ncbi:hypothetical protein CEV31_0083 [Brucella thiophenivorans]|uniref:Uncharacterized protein n=1 Tax=Brucella thiophenivorans TaxID=571255 RepID=A0A256G7C5_9HYPH|nr:hypothetical protein CEV31_0083 [Brucella thiophenivorans]
MHEAIQSLGVSESCLKRLEASRVRRAVSDGYENRQLLPQAVSKTGGRLAD